MKPCSDCGRIKPLDEFYSDRSRPDGRMYRCKVCLKAYRTAHPERIRAINAAHHDKYRDKLNADNRARRERSIEEYRARTRAYYARNSDKVKAINRAWQEANPELVRLYKWIGSHRRRARLAGADTYVISRRDLRRLLSGPCAVEGCSNHNLDIDHVIPLSRGGSHGVGNLQPLCKSHNSSKMDKTWMEFRVYLARKGEVAA